MSTLMRYVSASTIAILMVVAMFTAWVSSGEPPARLSARMGGELAEPLTDKLPPVKAVRGTMAITPGTKAQSILSFDDGTCEAGLGTGVHIDTLVDFDVPSQCIQAGLNIVGVTARVNTLSATAFGLGQAGTAPPNFTQLPTINIAPLKGLGPCPGTAVRSRAIVPGAAVITGTSNFFAGLRMGSDGGYIGRDTNSPPAMRQWLNCPYCAMDQYSPTSLTNLGFPGNFFIRVTVEDQNCIPVELMDFTVSDS